MYKPNDNATLKANWNWHQELVGTEVPRNGVPKGKLVRVNEELTHWTDSTGDQVYLALHGTVPSAPEEDLMRMADEMENALLNERENRLPIY